MPTFGVFFPPGLTPKTPGHSQVGVSELKKVWSQLSLAFSLQNMKSTIVWTILLIKG